MINIQELKTLAEKAEYEIEFSEFNSCLFVDTKFQHFGIESLPQDVSKYIAAANPETVIALINEIELLRGDLKKISSTLSWDSGYVNGAGKNIIHTYASQTIDVAVAALASSRERVGE